MVASPFLIGWEGVVLERDSDCVRFIRNLDYGTVISLAYKREKIKKMNSYEFSPICRSQQIVPAKSSNRAIVYGEQKHLAQEHTRLRGILRAIVS